MERSETHPTPATVDEGERRLAHAREVIRLEAKTIARLEEMLDGGFLAAVDDILACQGMVVVTGMGKAGLVGQKLSATLASTGTPSVALHPAEALHGDLGRIRAKDVLLMLSNSGETNEILQLLPHAKRLGATVIAVTGEPESTLARGADRILRLGRLAEACPLGLAPTASTSAMMALGDALSMVVLQARGFDREDFARFHPAGSLGRKLMRVDELMRTGAELPRVRPDDPVRSVLLTMSRTPGRPGAALVVDEAGQLVGIFTDGDLRRLLEDGAELLEAPVSASMGRSPKTVPTDARVEDAERLLREHKIDQIAVIDPAGRAVGLLDVQDVLNTRL